MVFFKSSTLLSMVPVILAEPDKLVLADQMEERMLGDEVNRCLLEKNNGWDESDLLRENGRILTAHLWEMPHYYDSYHNRCWRNMDFKGHADYTGNQFKTAEECYKECEVQWKREQVECPPCGEASTFRKDICYQGDKPVEDKVCEVERYGLGKGKQGKPKPCEDQPLCCDAVDEGQVRPNTYFMWNQQWKYHSLGKWTWGDDARVRKCMKAALKQKKNWMLVRKPLYKKTCYLSDRTPQIRLGKDGVLGSAGCYENIDEV